MAGGWILSSFPIQSILWFYRQKKWLVSWVLNIYIFFLFVFFWSKLQEAEKKNMELLTDIERLKKETEELRSEKGMATDIQVNNMCHFGGYILSVVTLQVEYGTDRLWHTKCEHNKCMLRCTHGSCICIFNTYLYCISGLLICLNQEAIIWVGIALFLFDIHMMTYCQKTVTSTDTIFFPFYHGQTSTLIIVVFYGCLRPVYTESKQLPRHS